MGWECSWAEWPLGQCGLG
jgi:hypothetical protein